jgi:predicted phosphodiesterase
MAKVGPDDFGYALETNDELQSLIRNRYFRWVINGHSHRQMVRAFPGVSVINAGTLRADHEPCFLEVDFIGESVTVFEFAADGASLLPANRVPLV